MKKQKPSCPLHANSGSKMLPIEGDWVRCNHQGCSYTRPSDGSIPQFVTNAVLRRMPHPTNMQGQTAVVKPATTYALAL